MLNVYYFKTLSKPLIGIYILVDNIMYILSYSSGRSIEDIHEYASLITKYKLPLKNAKGWSMNPSQGILIGRYRYDNI